jgi:hypothetical protein
VTGTKSGKTGTASLSVTPAALDHLVLSPASSSITAGGSQSYTAQGRDQYNNSLGDVTSSTVFSIGPDGSCTADTCTASVTGPHTVTGTKSGKTGTASLSVTAGYATTFGAPINGPSVLNNAKYGRVVPIQVDITSTASPVTSGNVYLEVWKTSTCGGAVDDVETYAAPGSSFTGNLLVYSGGHWRYNLDTSAISKPASFPACYQVKIFAGGVATGGVGSGGIQAGYFLLQLSK